jgi:hypothetical protein
MELRKIPSRIAIYARDVQNITGKSLRSSQRLIRKIRLAFGETGQPFVTVKEFCKYCRMEEEEVRNFLSI